MNLITLGTALLGIAGVLTLIFSKDVQTGQMELVSFFVRITAILVCPALSVWMAGGSPVILALLVLMALVAVLLIVWAVRQEKAPDDIRGLEDSR